jgi:hypothetical protein
MEINITEEDYKAYLAKKDTISNQRIRPDNQIFTDALLSVNMKNDPDGKKVIEAIKAL